MRVVSIATSKLLYDGADSLGIKSLKVGRLQVVPEGHFATPLANSELITRSLCQVPVASALGLAHLGVAIYRASFTAIAGVAQAG